MLIYLDFMKSQPNSAQAIAYFDKEFAYADGSHNVENLTLLGWFLCRHYSEETQTRELWHLMNPEILDHVTKREVLAIISRLAYIAVNLNAKILKAMPDGDLKRQALAYHAKIGANRKKYL